ncbi:MAG: alpha/beta hydrolase [Bacteroidota bacterium]
MKTIKNILKWTGVSLGSLLLLLILAGLISRLFSPEPKPPGRLVDVGGFKLHINAVGAKNHKPTLVIESGAGAPSEYYYWLGELLKDSIRVVRYDRAGIGYSEAGNEPRDPETIARELHQLLEISGEQPPYVLAGHSYGGHFIRIFKQLYPNEVVGLVFLDSGHPDESDRLKMPPGPKYLDALYKIGVVAGDLGLLNLYNGFSKRPLLWAPGLPENVIKGYKDYVINGNYIRGYLEEEKGYEKLVEMSREISTYDTIPIRIFAGTNLNEPLLRKMGIDPEFIRTERAKMQREMASCSSNGKVFFLKGGHITIFSLEESAQFICDEILKFVHQLEQ